MSGPLSKPQSSVRRTEEQKNMIGLLQLMQLQALPRRSQIYRSLTGWFVCRVMQKQLDGFQLHLEGTWKMGQESLFNFEVDLGMFFCFFCRGGIAEVSSSFHYLILNGKGHKKKLCILI